MPGTARRYAGHYAGEGGYESSLLIGVKTWWENHTNKQCAAHNEFSEDRGGVLFIHQPPL